MPLSHTNENAYGPIYYLTKPVLFYTPVASYAIKVLKTDPIAYWVQGEASGLVAVDQVDSPAQDGIYQGVTLGQPGIGDGNTAPRYDGVNDFTDIYSASLAAAFDATQGTLAIWARVAAVGDWTDGVIRVMVQLFVDGNNFVRIDKGAGNNTLEFIYRAGAVTKQRNVNPVTDLIFMHLAATWSASADEFRVYFNGAQSGATLNALGAWVGALANTRCLIGANTQVPANVWDGYLAHCVVWDRPLSAPEIADLAVIE